MALENQNESAGEKADQAIDFAEYSNEILKTAPRRAQVSRKLLEQRMGLNAEECCNIMKDAGINMTKEEWDNDQRMTQNVLEFQKKIGLPLVDRPYGADGMFGPVTYRNFELYAQHELDKKGIKRESRRAVLATMPIGPARSGETVNKAASNITEKLPRSWLFSARDAAAQYQGEFKLQKIEPSVILATINIESGFRPSIRNPRSFSSATGLGQFIGSTWGEFVSENIATVARVTGRAVPPPGPARLALRTDPDLSIYATIWYAAKNFASLKGDLGAAQAAGVIPRDVNINRIDSKSAPYVYLAHHDGTTGARNMLRYKVLRAQGKSISKAAREAKLNKRQRHYSIYDNKDIPTHYQDYADKHWAEIVEGYHPTRTDSAPRKGQAIAIDSGQYKEEMDRWFEDPVNRYFDNQYLEEVAQVRHLPGQTSVFGTSSATGYMNKFEGGKVDGLAKGGKNLKWVSEQVEAQDEFGDRVILDLNGIKNSFGRTDNRASVRKMIQHIKAQSPQTKIYLVEATPQQERKSKALINTNRIMDFNQFLNSEKLKALGVSKVIPFHRIASTSSGNIDERRFGKTDGLHLGNYDRYAGVIADYITLNEGIKKDGPDSSASQTA